MQQELLLSMTSLIGVGLGGGLSYLAQLTTQRQANRGEEHRQARELAEQHRAERMDILRQFVLAAQQAERRAWTKDDSRTWHAETHEIMDQLWIRERLIYVLFGRALYAGAQTYARALNQAVWSDAVPRDELADFLEQPRITFLDAAHAELGNPSASPLS